MSDSDAIFASVRRPRMLMEDDEVAFESRALGRLVGLVEAVSCRTFPCRDPELPPNAARIRVRIDGRDRRFIVPYPKLEVV